MLQDEYWYGGCVKDGTRMPLSAESAVTVDTTVNMTPNQAMPLFVSSKGRYLWKEGGFRAVFREGAICVPDDCIISVPYGTLKKGYLEAMKAHFPFHGKMPSPELFKNPIYNTWIELTFHQNQKDILKYAEGILAHGMPAGVLMIDDGWSEYYGNWTFHSGKFPDAGGMLERLHQMGFSVMLWICPFISADSLKFREALALDILIKDGNDEPYMVHWWNGYSAVLDLSNPSATEWLQKQLDDLTALGVDGFKFDAGDSIHYLKENRTYANTTPNEQSMLWERFGEKYAFNEYRVTFQAGGAPVLQRLCDKLHSWDAEGVGGLIPDSLLQGITGHPFCCPDMIGGGEYVSFWDAMAGKFDEELFLRYCEVAALMPAMQFSADPYRVLSKDGFGIVLKCIETRRKYMDYILECVQKAAVTGEPVIRYMTYEYPDEPAEKIVDQFMLGDRYLAAPVIKKGNKGRSVYLPKGKWIRSGKEVTGQGDYIWCEEDEEALILFEKG